MEREKLKDILSAPWLDKLGSFIESKEFDRITNNIAERRARKVKIVPRTDRVFTALNKCPPDKVKVVMGLQDPYNSIEPDGIAMSCSLSNKLQPSLREVYREIHRTTSYEPRTEEARAVERPKPLDLSHWCEQGVLMINASLTVEWRTPNSDKGLWDKFIDEVFHEGVNLSPNPIVYILLGKDAQECFSKYARLGDYILTASHPASVSYSGGVWDCSDVFGRCNRYLELHGLEPIKW